LWQVHSLPILPLFIWFFVFSHHKKQS
jgi:hypothetical protein